MLAYCTQSVGEVLWEWKIFHPVDLQMPSAGRQDKKTPKNNPEFNHLPLFIQREFTEHL